MKYIYCMIAALAFDHKGEEGGSVLVYFFVAAYFIFYAANKLFERRSLRVDGYGLLCFFALGFPLAFSVLHILLGQLQFGDFVRAGLPFAVAFAMFDVISRLNLEELFRISRYSMLMALVSSAYTFAYGLSSNDVSLTEIRFQIISPYSMLILALAVSSAIILADRSLLCILSILGTCGVILISVTRGALLAAISIGIGAFFLNTFGSLRTRRYGAVKALILIFSLAGLIGAVFPESLERLVERSSTREAYGYDPTTLTRLAEVAFQWDRLTESPLSLLSGYGIGSTYSWSGIYDAELRPFLSENDLFGQFSYVGHNFWVYSLYASGVVVGVILPAVVIISTLMAVFNAIKMRRSSSYVGFRLEYLQFSLALFWVGTVVSTVGGNPFVTRQGGLAVGLFLGLQAAIFRCAVVGRTDWYKL